MVSIRAVPVSSKPRDRDNQAQGGHDGAAGDAGSADSEHAQQHAEENHGAGAGQSAVEDLGDDHDEEELRSETEPQRWMLANSGDAEVNHVAAEGLGLLGAAQGHSPGWRRRDMVPTAVM